MLVVVFIIVAVTVAVAVAVAVATVILADPVVVQGLDTPLDFLFRSMRQKDTQFIHRKVFLLSLVQKLVLFQ